MAESQIRISSPYFFEKKTFSENSKGKEFDGFQIILKLEICAEKIVFNCSTLKKNRLLFVTFKKQRRRQRVLKTELQVSSLRRRKPKNANFMTTLGWLERAASRFSTETGVCRRLILFGSG